MSACSAGAARTATTATTGHLGVGSFSLIGHSLGGAVAAELAEQARERSLNLTSLAPAGFGPVLLAEWLEGGVPAERGLLGRVIRRAVSTAPGAAAANQAIVAVARDPDGFAHRPVSYDGQVSVL